MFEIENESMNLLRDENETEKLNPNLDGKKFDYEEALSVIGLGKFQFLLLFICGLANASDAIEILCVSFILPAAECDLKMSSSDKGFLSSMTFAGMMVGSYTWGSLSDLFGRKYVLMLALLFNAIFGIACGLSQSFLPLLFFRFLSGIGIKTNGKRVGGSVPIVWSYFSEFLPKNIRGKMICCLASSWFFGNLFVILFAYLILNSPSINYNLFSGFIIINNWRLFMIVCSLPSIITALLLFLLPESPKFCLVNGQKFKAKKILRKIYACNHRSKTANDLENKKKAFELFDLIRVSSTMDDLDSDENGSDLILTNEDQLAKNKHQTKLRKIFHITGTSVKNILNKTLSIFKPPYTTNTLIVFYIMFALCFGYYGLWMWLPELYKRMNKYGGSPCQSGLVINTTEIKNDTSHCHIDTRIYLSSFYSALSNLPGNLITIFFIDKMGRNLLTSLSLIASGLSVFGIPFITSENQGVVLTTIFGGINVITFNSFGCTSTELYPTKLRSTALGIQYVLGRLGAIMGNLIFGLAVDISCYIPLVTIAVLMISSGLLAFKLPESKNADIH